MSFNVIIIRDESDGNDAGLYPITGNEPSSIQLEPADGKQVKTLFAKTLRVEQRVGNTLNRVAGASDITATVYITDSRFAVACSKYDKGGGWYGGVGALALNAASHAMASHRRKGKMLVGQVRYRWLSSVGFQEKTSAKTVDALRFGVFERVNGVEREVYFSVHFPKGTDTKALATLIIRRAAEYRLATDLQMSTAEFRAFQALTTVTLQASPGAIATTAMPSKFPATPGTAYPPNRPDGQIGPLITDAVAELAAPLMESPRQNQPELSPVVPVLSQTGVQRDAVPVTALQSGAPKKIYIDHPGIPLPAATPQSIDPTPRPVTQPLTPAQPLAQALPIPESAVDHPARWARDPYGRHEYRYWDGVIWSEHVSDAGQPSIDRWPPTTRRLPGMSY